MITKFEKYNESLRDLMVGPTEEEVLNSYKDLSPDELLMKSAKIGSIKGVEIALDRGTDVHVYEDEPIICSSENGYTDIVKLLLDKGADIHVNDDCPLRFASGYGHTDTVKLLLDRGADIHANNDCSLRWALKNGHTETVELLKSYMNKSTNESLRDLMVGPSNEEIWKYYGYDKPFNTPKEYFDNLVKDVKIKPRPDRPSSVYWEKDDKIIIEYQLDSRYLYMSKEMKTVFEHIFKIPTDELIELFSDFVGEQLNWKTLKKVYPSYLTKKWN